MGAVISECGYNHPVGTRCPACADWPYKKGGAAVYFAAQGSTVMTPEPAPQAESPEALLAHLQRMPMTEWVWADAERIFATLAASPTPPAPERGAVEAKGYDLSTPKGRWDYYRSPDSVASSAALSLPATERSGNDRVTVALDNHMHLTIEPGEEGVILVNEAGDPIAYGTMPATEKAAEVEKMRAMREQIALIVQGCCQGMEGGMGHCDQYDAADVILAALATQPATLSEEEK